MTYNRPSQRHDGVAAVALNHGDPVLLDGYVGVAQKQKQPASGAGTGTPQTQIAIGETFTILIDGVVQVPYVATAVKGTPIYITAANVLTLTAAGNTKYGRVEDVPGQRGTPTGFMRVNLDAKDTF